MTKGVSIRKVNKSRPFVFAAGQSCDFEIHEFGSDNNTKKSEIRQDAYQRRKESVLRCIERTTESSSEKHTLHPYQTLGEVH